MTSTTMIILVALVGQTLAQFRLPQVPVRGGAFSPAYSPAQMPHIEVAKKYGLPGQGSPAFIPDSRSVASSVVAGGLSPAQLAFMERQNAARGIAPTPVAAPAVPAGGLSPSQLAFMERQNAARGLAPTQQYQPPVFTQPSYSSPSYSSSSTSAGKRGYTPAYAPSYFPSFAGEPPALELDDNTQASSNVSIFAAALIGTLVGASVTFAMHFRRSASTALKEPLV